MEFADFTRYSFRRHGDFTTLAEELQSIDRYLLLERARFGERLKVSLQISPEVLGTVIPFLSLQPLVENSVRHGLDSIDGEGHITIAARDAGALAEITVEDNGVGMDPKKLQALLAGHADGDHVGLRNVDLQAAPGLRRRPRPGDRYRGRRRHPDHHADPQVAAGPPNLKEVVCLPCPNPQSC